ncbi:P-loop containing nucleoside triphosphate hydrolase protein [Lipomyces arxii]|uniref:P-loop containing nucleoside triphosphate hydrolase protein n=1 Tax=Lipomyces arxii TaxID=56418 RepID=UPI0034CE0F01
MSYSYIIWVVAGPAGCGKSTIAEYLSKEFNGPYVEGDDLHDSASITKMSHGIALNDEDRGPWLDKIIPETLKAIRELHGTETGHHYGFVTCSSLKKKYRDHIRASARSLRDHRGISIGVRFLFVTVDEEVLIERVRARPNHYMKEPMVTSQLNIMELPTISESDSLLLNSTGKTKEEINALAKKDVLSLP